MSSFQERVGFRHWGNRVPPNPYRPLPRRSIADPTAQAFGDAVRRARQERNWTLEDVARRIKRMDAKYLGEIERGWHAPTIPTAKRIAEALDTTLADLVRDL